MGNLVTLQYPRGPDSSMVEHLVQFQKGLGLSPDLVTFHAAIRLGCLIKVQPIVTYQLSLNNWINNARTQCPGH